MRSVCKLKNEEHARRFAGYLFSRGIENRLEGDTGSDWASNDYGDVTFTVWVFDEDDFALAKQHWSDFQEDPEDSRFKVDILAPAHTTAPPEVSIDEAHKESRYIGRNLRDPKRWKEAAQRLASQPKQLQKSRTSTFTFYFVMLCTALFTWTLLHAPQRTERPPYLPPTAIYAAELQKDLLFDYPDKDLLADRLLLLYGTEALMKPGELPEEGQILLRSYFDEPYWAGAYNHFLNFGMQSWGRSGADMTEETETSADEVEASPRLFERISEGQLWRLFTPCLLHGDIFHLLFNMIWLAMVGSQIETRIRKGRYLLFILLTGVLSNLSQYLMSGYSFLGFSGIICAMITFVWARQRRAPWEGYLLQGSTIGFITLFIFAMLGLQVAAFILQITAGTTFSPNIANTAHIVGGITGLFLGNSRFGRWTT